MKINCKKTYIKQKLEAKIKNMGKKNLDISWCKINQAILNNKKIWGNNRLNKNIIDYEWQEFNIKVLEEDGKKCQKKYEKESHHVYRIKYLKYCFWVLN